MKKRVVQIVALTTLTLGFLYIFAQSMARVPVPPFAGNDPAKLSQRARVECPKPGPGTLVLVGLGQSNAGNWGELTASTQKNGDSVIEYWQGNCYAATSPMLGATGEGESLWPVLGKTLVQTGYAKQVLISVFAVDGASIGRFVSKGDLRPLWRAQLARLLDKYPVDYYLWLQGEADFARGTSKDEYAERFSKLRKDIEELDGDALVFVSIETYCSDIERWTPGNDVARAQSEISKAFPGTLPGVNSDAVLAFQGARWDGCHPSAQGYRIWSEAWNNRIVHEMSKHTSSQSIPSKVLK